MEGLLELLVPIVRLISSVVLVILFFIFIVRPLLNYFIVNNEIEHRKKINVSLKPEFTFESNRSSESSREEGDMPPEDETIENASQSMEGNKQRELNTLASNNTDKAVDLVKHWVNSESSRK